MMISCKKATYLISKQEEGKLYFFEKVKLQLHLSICKFCRLFELQTRFIGKNAGHAQEHLDQMHLSDSSKEKMKLALDGIFE